MTLKLNGLTVDCVIGERADERTRLQRLSLDVTLEIGDKPSVSDELADTVDYATLAQRIRTALVAAECRMIERAARIAADVCRGDVHVRRVRVAVTKPGAVPGLASATAVVELVGSVP